MTPAFSLYLDLVRFLAALTVLVSHFAYPRFSGGFLLPIRELNLGSDAVMIFFVLSGFVIAYCVAEKERGLTSFAFNRATRIYSVALPAVVLTLAFDAIGRWVDPAAYDGWWYGTAPLSSKLYAGLTFTNEIWFNPVRIGTNGPYWSLAYEVWYYVLFAFLVYVRRPLRPVLVVGIALFVGPAVMALWAVWLVGAWLYHHLRSARPLNKAVSWGLALAPPAAYLGLLAAGLPAELLAATKALIGEAAVETGLRFSDEFVWNAILGLLVACHFVGVWHLCAAHPAVLSRWKGPIRWLAGGSFSLYLVHYPALQLGDALLSEALPTALRNTALLAFALGTCFAFAQLTERQLGPLRALLGRSWRHPQRSSGGAVAAGAQARVELGKRLP